MRHLSRCAELDLILISAVKEEGGAPQGGLLHLSLQSEIILLI